jgi:hypothetical protein
MIKKITVLIVLCLLFVLIVGNSLCSYKWINRTSVSNDVKSGTRVHSVVSCEMKYLCSLQECAFTIREYIESAQNCVDLNF